MEEDEISLKDYIRVLKKEKVIMTSIFLAAVVFASVYSFLLPDEYLMEAKLSYVQGKALSLPDTVDILRSQSIIQEVAAEDNVSQKSMQSTFDTLRVENIKNTDKILIQLRGYNPELMKDSFDQYLKVALSELNRRNIEKSTTNESKLESLYISYAEQRERTKAEMDEKLMQEADLEIRRLENLSAVVARIGSKDKQTELEFKISELESIKEGRKSSDAARQLISSNPDLAFLDSKLKSIDGKLVDIENKKAELEDLDPAVLKMVVPIEGPSVIGPKRELNVAVAAVLGLFAGIFAAFLKNYLEDSTSK